MSEERKRPAFEPPSQLIRRVETAADMPRPTATVAGAVLVLLRVAAGALWTVSVALLWTTVLDDAGILAELAPEDLARLDDARGVFIVLAAIVLVVQAVLAVLILRGWNWPRVVVMTWAVLFIAIAFIGWWADGEVITLQTTLPSLGLDVLILLALSSRRAAAYARRPRRTAPGPAEAG